MDKAEQNFGLTGIASASATLGALGASKAAYEIQENVYGRPNILKPIAEFLHNPDYLTSFTYPLLLMYAMKTGFAWAQEFNAETFKSTKTQEFLDIATTLTPFIVMGLNTWHEVASHPNYVDHPELDILAGAAAGLFFVLSTGEQKNVAQMFKDVKEKIFPSNTPISQEPNQEKEVI